MNSTLQQERIVKATVSHNAKELSDVGLNVGKFYTDKGLPLDISLSKLDYSREDKAVILSGALWWLVEHRRESGATEAALNRQRATNVKIMDNFIKKGEAGVY